MVALCVAVQSNTVTLETYNSKQIFFDDGTGPNFKVVWLTKGQQMVVLSVCRAIFLPTKLINMKNFRANRIGVDSIQ